jgi:hypothetical protein
MVDACHLVADMNKSLFIKAVLSKVCPEYVHSPLLICSRNRINADASGGGHIEMADLADDCCGVVLALGTYFTLNSVIRQISLRDNF